MPTCDAPAVSTHEQLISKSFHGRHGRAFLFTTATNVMLGPKEERVLMTGLHSVCDIFCSACTSRLGWKYVEAFESRCAPWSRSRQTNATDLPPQTPLMLASRRWPPPHARQSKVQGGQVHRGEGLRRRGRGPVGCCLEGREPARVRGGKLAHQPEVR